MYADDVKFCLSYNDIASGFNLQSDIDCFQGWCDEHHLSAIKSVLSLLFNRDLLIVLGDFNLPDISWSPPTDSLVAIPLSVHDFIDGLFELSLQQVSFIRNSLKRQLDLVFVSDPSEVTVSRIEALVVPEDRYQPTLDLTICLPCVDTLSPLVPQTKRRCFRKCDYKKLNVMISQYNWTGLYNCMDIESVTELFYIVLNNFFNECVPDRLQSLIGLIGLPMRFKDLKT